MGHQPKEHQAELEQSEVLEKDNPMRHLSENKAAGSSSVSGGRRMQSSLERARRDNFAEKTSESQETSGQK